jgi:hypothetical protein
MPEAAAARTGSSGLSSGTVSVQSIPAGSYKLSFWARRQFSPITGTISGTVNVSVDDSSWKYYEMTLSSPSTITLSLSAVHVDDLRLHPVGCEVTTYTYHPLFGMTSATDPNNLSSFYEYDSLGRLNLMRDSKGRIVKAFQYHLKNGTP